MGYLVEMMAHEFTGLVLHGKEWVFHELPRPGALKGGPEAFGLHRLPQAEEIQKAEGQAEDARALRKERLANMNTSVCECRGESQLILGQDCIFLGLLKPIVF